MNYYKPFFYNTIYHVYNHGNGNDDIFIDEDNYVYFLVKLHEYLSPVIDLYCYNMLGNHFHLLFKVKSEEQVLIASENWCRIKNKPFKVLNISQQFSNMFNSYAKSINKRYSRVGSLFRESLKRIEINSDDKFSKIIAYIHCNAQHHGIVKDFREWPHSSFKHICNANNSFVHASEIIQWFGNMEKFLAFHQTFANSLLFHKKEDRFDL